MRIDAHVTGRIQDLEPIFSVNLFEACISVGAGEHPLAAAQAVIADPHDFEVLHDADTHGIGVDFREPPSPDLLARFPALRIAVPLSPGVLELAPYPNVYVKLIVTPELRSLATEVLSAFGPDRVMFASGWPRCSSWKVMLANFTQACGPLPQAVREQILGETAARFYLRNRPHP